MNTTKLIVSSAIASLVSLASSGVAVAQDKPAAAKEKCYGVAKKGANDCGTAKHSCSGNAAADNLPEEWKFVAKGTCEAMKGSLKKPGDAKPAKSEPAKQTY